MLCVSDVRIKNVYYLGVKVDKGLQFVHQMEQTIGKVNARFRSFANVRA